jgi:cation:H+ antiporter
VISDLLGLSLSLGMLTGGAILLVRGAAALARRMGVSSFFIGLTIVGFGTSTPELFASIFPAIRGHGGIAVGNVIGSNIFNVAMILGATALVCPIPVKLRVVRREVLVVLAVSVLPLLALTAGGRIERWHGVLMLAGLGGYLWRGYREARGEAEEEIAAVERGIEHELAIDRTAWHTKVPASLAFAAAGIALLVTGADLLVASATGIARAGGLSEFVIGLTVVAAGTSMPELATSLVAAARKQPDIAVGNILGSNVFNILAILGLTCTVRPQTLAPQALWLDLPVMLLASAALLPIFTTQARISRLEGAFLLSGYIAYMATLFVIHAA